MDYDGTICISTRYGELEDVPVRVDYNHDYGRINTVIIDFADIDSFKADRDALIKMTSKAEVERQEELLAQEIQVQWDAGDFKEQA